MTRRKLTCKGETLPMVRLALEKAVCLRTGGRQLNTPSGIAAFVTEHYGCRPQEVFLAFYFGPNNELLAVQEVGVGGLASAPVDPKVLFAGAVSAGAVAVVLVHNHPSGSSEPSTEDMRLTKQLVDGAALLTIRVLDHIIVARGGGYASLVERGAMPKASFMGFGDESLAYKATPRAPGGQQVEGVLPPIPVEE